MSKICKSLFFGKLTGCEYLCYKTVACFCMRVYSFISLIIICLFGSISCVRHELEIKKEPRVSIEKYRGLTVGNPVPIEGENLDGLKWDSNRFFVAEVDASQRIVPKHIGFTQIWCSNGPGYLSVEVVPKYSDYDMPIIFSRTGYDDITYEDQCLFGLPSATVYSFEYQYGNRVRDNRSTSTLLVYKTGNVKSPYVTYSFDNDKLVMAGTIISPTYVSNLSKFLSERYEIFAFDLVNYTAYFEHRKGGEKDQVVDVMGGIQYSSQLGGILLMLMPYDGTRSVSFDEELDDFRKQIEELIL